MSKDYKKELKDMERLMMYGLNESTNKTPDSGILEYSQIGADGQTYGILREGTKYFVKVAPKKDTKVLAEDFDYVGGFMNRKPYDSYTTASKALNLHLISLNEEVGGKEPVKSQYAINESAEWQTATTKEARKELNRFYELVSKVDNILSENVHYVNEDKNAPYTDKSSASYNSKNGGGHKGNIGTQQPLGITEKGFTNDDEKDAEKKQAAYEKAKVNDKNGFGDHNIDEDGGNAYTEKTPKKLKESKKRVIKLSEEQGKQVLAWRDDRAFVHKNVDTDRSHGTEIGDTDPWTEPVNESFETEEWGSEGLPSSPGVGDAKKYPDPFDNKNGVRQPVTENFDECGMQECGLEEDDDMYLGDYDDEDDEAYAKYAMEPGIDDDERDERIYDLLNNRGESESALGFANGGFGDDDDDIEYEAEYDGSFDPTLNEASEDDEIIDMLPDTDYDDEDYNSEVDGYEGYDDEDYEDEEPPMIFEVTLNDFGKHPAYRKKPMTLPQNADGSEWGEDWNDESTKTELPFGRKIGDSAPFNQKVDAITNAVVEMLSKKKN